MNANSGAFAIHKNARISAQKARLVVDLIRNKRVDDALNILSFCNKKAALLVKKSIVICYCKR